MLLQLLCSSATEQSFLVRDLRQKIIEGESHISARKQLREKYPPIVVSVWFCVMMRFICVRRTKKDSTKTAWIEKYTTHCYFRLVLLDAVIWDDKNKENLPFLYQNCLMEKYTSIVILVSFRFA